MIFVLIEGMFSYFNSAKIMLNLQNLTLINMKRKLILAILMICIPLILPAQKLKDALYLKNGSLIYGQLVEVTDATYKIRTSDGSLMIYPASEVEKFSQSPVYFEGRKAQGFSFSLEAGLLVGSQGSRFNAPLSFNILAGITSNTKNITSFGSGVEFIGRPYTPFFIEYKYVVNNNKTSPFLFLRGGAVVPFGGEESSTTTPNYYDYGPKDYKGGLSFAFGSGISWAKPDHETYLSFAYRYAHISYTQSEPSRGDVSYEDSLNRLEIKFGFKF